MEKTRERERERESVKRGSERSKGERKGETEKWTKIPLSKEEKQCFSKNQTENQKKKKEGLGPSAQN